MIILFFLSVLLFQNSGTPLIKNYSPKVYKSNSKNWSVTQSDNGVLFFANESCILKYNGVSWDRYMIPNDIVRSVYYYNGYVYVGGINEIGRLKPNVNGQFIYESLTHLLPKHERRFRDVWNIYSINDQIYFASQDKILCYKDNSIRIFLSGKKLRLSFQLGNTILIQLYDGKISSIINDKVKPYYSGSFFKDKAIVSLISIAKNDIIISTLSKGVYRFKEGKLTVFSESFQMFFASFRC